MPWWYWLVAIIVVASGTASGLSLASWGPMARGGGTWRLLARVVSFPVAIGGLIVLSTANSSFWLSLAFYGVPMVVILAVDLWRAIAGWRSGGPSREHARIEP